MNLQPLNKTEFAALKKKWLKLLKDNEHPVLEADYRQVFGRIEASG
ncbi:MAG: hypothetical protein ACOY3V_01320 [Pseudomonadota bacterium]